MAIGKKNIKLIIVAVSSMGATVGLLAGIIAILDTAKVNYIFKNGGNLAILCYILITILSGLLSIIVEHIVSKDEIPEVKDSNDMSVNYSISGFMSTEEIKSLLSKAKSKFWILGIKNSRISNLCSEILDKIQKSHDIEFKILYLDYKSPKVILDNYKDCTRSHGVDFAETIKYNIKMITSNKDLQKYPNNLSLKAYAEFPVIPCIIVDNEVHFGHFLKNTQTFHTYNSPYFCTTSGDLIKSMIINNFNRIWEYSRDVSFKINKDKWILFDLDQTLYNNEKLLNKYENNSMNYFGKFNSINSEDLIDKWEQEKIKFSKKFNRVPASRELLEHLGFPLETWEIITRDIYPDEYLNFNHELLQFFSKLSNYYKIGILTNNSKKQAILTLDAIGIRQFFKTIVCADEFGKLKPNPEVFKKTLEKLDVKKKEIIFIGESLTYDINIPISLGYRTIILKDYNYKKIIEELNI